MVKRAGVGKRAKHIDTQFMYMQDISRSGEARLEAVAGTENPADLGTKCVAAGTLVHLLKKLHMEWAD